MRDVEGGVAGVEGDGFGDEGVGVRGLDGEGDGVRGFGNFLPECGLRFRREAWAVFLGAEGKAEEVSAKIFQERGELWVNLGGLPGGEGVGGDGACAEGEFDGGEMAAFLGDVE